MSHSGASCGRRRGSPEAGRDRRRQPVAGVFRRSPQTAPLPSPPRQLPRQDGPDRSGSPHRQVEVCQGSSQVGIIQSTGNMQNVMDNPFRLLFVPLPKVCQIRLLSSLFPLGRIGSASGKTDRGRPLKLISSCFPMTQMKSGRSKIDLSNTKTNINSL